MEVVAIVAGLFFLLLVGLPKAAVDQRRDAADRRNSNSSEAMAWHGASGCLFWIIVLAAGALFLAIAGGGSLLALLGDTWFR